jgi:sulfite exporter TauE/SafE
MELIFELVSACRQGLAHFGSASGALAGPLFLAGLAGSAVHCAGMCGPFVISQVVADSRNAIAGYGEWRRLAGAALLPYHLGRLTTYAALGAIAGASTALFASTAIFALLSGALLVLGAVLMLAQAVGFAVQAPLAAAGVLARWTRPLSSSSGPLARYALGVVLGFLPCGLIFGALGMAASTGSPFSGALAMASFGAGTIPALVVVGWGGVLLRRRWQATARWIAVPLLVFNAALMLALAGARL